MPSKTYDFVGQVELRNLTYDCFAFMRERIKKKLTQILGQLFVCRLGQTKEWLHPEPGDLWGQR